MTIIDIDEIDKLVKRDIVIFTCENCFKETSKSVNALRKNILTNYYIMTDHF